MLAVRQSRLHDVALAIGGLRTPGLSLFPFFDDGGSVQAAMVTSDADGRIVLLDRSRLSRAVGSRRAWSVAQGLLLDPSHWADLSTLDAVDVEELWHFDPWWELAEARYDGHPAVPAIKQTNLPAYDGELSEVWFDRTLSRVVWFVWGEGEEARQRPFRPRLLAAAREARRRESAPPSRVAPSREGWRLRPYW